MAVKATGAKLDFQDVDLKDGEIDRISVRATFRKKKKSATRGTNVSVKINEKLLAEVEEFINLDANEFKYISRKHFVDLAVSDFLKREKKKVNG